jgi:Lon protease-like protein
MSDYLAALNRFDGRARLFPLPNFVLFPCVIHPLHIFEPRYRQMTADALAGDRLIAMALLRPGWEQDYEGSPAIHPVICLGRIVSAQRLDDGRYNLLLQGLARARVVEEVQNDRLYRVAQAELLFTASTISPHEERRLRRHLGEQVPGWFPANPQLVEQFQKLLQRDLPLGALCDILSFALPLEPAFKQQLLEELDVERRIDRLLTRLKTPPAAMPAETGPRKFPPEFSVN